METESGSENSVLGDKGEYVMHNDEVKVKNLLVFPLLVLLKMFYKLAAILPSKTIPLTSSGTTKRCAHEKSKKRKAQSTINTSKSKKLHATIDETALSTSITTPQQSQHSSSALVKTSSMGSVSSTVIYYYSLFS